MDDNVRLIDVAAVAITLAALAAPAIVAALDVPSRAVAGWTVFGGAVVAGLTVFVAALGYVHRDLAAYIAGGIVVVVLGAGVTQEAPSVTTYKAQVAAQQREAYRQELARREDQRITNELQARRVAGEIFDHVMGQDARRERRFEDDWNYKMDKAGQKYCDNTDHRLNDQESYTGCLERWGHR